MTALEAIQELDALRPNSFPQEQKLVWLDRLDSFLQRSVLDRYPGRAGKFTPGDLQRELIMEEPFCEGYLSWLEGKIHYYNLETDRYNSAMALFRGQLEDWQRELHRREDLGKPGQFQF